MPHKLSEDKKIRCWAIVNSMSMSLSLSWSW